jgi:hypothetical protein
MTVARKAAPANAPGESGRKSLMISGSGEVQENEGRGNKEGQSLEKAAGFPAKSKANCSQYISDFPKCTHRALSKAVLAISFDDVVSKKVLSELHRRRYPSASKPLLTTSRNSGQ